MKNLAISYLFIIIHAFLYLIESSVWGYYLALGMMIPGSCVLQTYNKPQKMKIHIADFFIHWLPGILSLFFLSGKIEVKHFIFALILPLIYLSVHTDTDENGWTIFKFIHPVKHLEQMYGKEVNSNYIILGYYLSVLISGFITP
jgi:hypothetical protein